MNHIAQFAAPEGCEPAPYLPEDPRAAMIFAGDECVLKPRPGRLFVGPGMARAATAGLDSEALLDCAAILWMCAKGLEGLAARTTDPRLDATREVIRGVTGAVADAMGDLSGTVAMLAEAQAIEAEEYERAVRVASPMEGDA